MSKANGLKEHTENYDNKSDIGYTRLKQKWKKSHKNFFRSVQKQCKEKEKAEKKGTCKVLCIFWGWCLNG